LSVYFGLSAGLRLLSVSFFRIALQNNAFASCVVRVDVLGGNAYGGGVSLYIGGYSSVFSSNGEAAAAVGDTVVRNVSVTLDTTRFESCSAMRTNGVDVSGANVYGGSFSFYIGGYTWSQSVAGGNSSSTCGATNVSGVLVRVQSVSSLNSRASTTSVGGFSDGANSYGGSMSVLHIGAYAWSWSNAASSSSSSRCEATSANSVSLQVSDSACWNCSALSTSGSGSSGANSYGGSMSVLYVGAYAWSLSNAASRSSSSKCEATSVNGVSVQVSDSVCWNCSASSTSGSVSLGASSYGGSMSVLYVGAYAWSLSLATSSSSSSRCEATSANGVSVQVSDSVCSNCSALITSGGSGSFGASSYGGSMSVLYVGAYAWSVSDATSSSSSSRCEATSASGVSVHVSDSACSNCSALSTSGGSGSFGANSYGGSMSVLYVGAFSYSLAEGEFRFLSRSVVGATRVYGLSITIKNATISDAEAVSGELCSMHPIRFSHKLT
jgi:hypothetical protein